MTMVPHPPVRPLSRRDWVLLPLIVLATALAVLTIPEAAARLIWPEEKVDACAIRANRITPAANCVATVQAAGGPPVVNRYNECGYRAETPCTPTAPNVSRIVAIGSSLSWGYLVPWDQTWFSQVARMQARCGRGIDVQALGGYGTLSQTARRLDEAAALKPRLVVLVLGQFDLEHTPEGRFELARTLLPASMPPHRREGLISHVRAYAQASRAVSMAQALAYRERDWYIDYYLSRNNADSMRMPLSAPWQRRLTYLDQALGYMARRLNARGISFLVAYVPEQAQADIIGAGDAYPATGLSPYALNRALGAIARRHGILYADGADAFRGVADAPRYFYRADGHINAAGHGLLGTRINETVVQEHVTGFCGAPGL